jgi:hypothetical protein
MATGTLNFKPEAQSDRTIRTLPGPGGPAGPVSPFGPGGPAGDPYRLVVLFCSLPIPPAMQMQAPCGLHAFYNLLKMVTPP